MKNVLVPIDGSAAALRAMALAQVELHGVRGRHLHLLNVQAPNPRPRPGQHASPDDDDEELRRRGFDVLGEAREKTLGREVEPRLHVRIGPIGDEIVSCAHELECDAIIMGTQGLGGAAAARLGSVAARVVQLARIPVTLVK